MMWALIAETPCCAGSHLQGELSPFHHAATFQAANSQEISSTVEQNNNMDFLRSSR